MLALLQAASKELGLPYISGNRGQQHANGQQPSLGHMLGGRARGVVLLDDTWPWVVTDEIRDHFFVVGTVRPPCDWEVSQWACECIANRS